MGDTNRSTNIVGPPFLGYSKMKYLISCSSIKSCICLPVSPSLVQLNNYQLYPYDRLRCVVSETSPGSLHNFYQSWVLNLGKHR